MLILAFASSASRNGTIVRTDEDEIVEEEAVRSLHIGKCDLRI